MARTKTWLGRASALTALTAAMGLAFSGLAYADTLQDTIADTGAGVTLVAGSSTSGSAGIRVIGNSAAQDPDSGCNIDPGESPLRLDIVTPSGVTANPDPLSLTSCGNDFTVSFTASSTAVSGIATVTVLSAPAGGGTYVNQVSIPITVTPPVVTNTAPVVSVTGVSNGQTYQKSAVPQPGCSVTDAEDSNESATPQVTNGAFDSLGQHTVTCSYTDKGTPALSDSDTATYTVVRDRDTTAPVISYSLDPTNPSGANGWYAGDVSLTWTVTENESPETLQLSGCADRSVTTDQAATTYSCAATSEGGAAAEQSVSIKRDATAPVVGYDGVVSGTAGAGGWYSSDVSVRFTATDATSGPSTSSEVVTTSGDGSAVQVSSPAFTDNAGNTTAAGAATSPAFKIDTRAPAAPTASLRPAPNGAGWNNTDAVVSFTANGDNGPSGVANCTADVTVDTDTDGRTVSGTCTDNAGNVSAATEVTVKRDTIAPTIGRTLSGAPANANGWYNHPVDVDFTCADSGSGVDSCTGDVTLTDGANQSASGTATDVAGNTASNDVTGINIDTAAPVVSLAGGPAGSSYFGSVPAAPTCNASDALSGLAGSCEVSGYSTAVGTHTVTATARDRAGNTSSDTLTYTVLAWTTKGFYSPVDMFGVWNTVKGGSTVPLKFELFAGPTELTSTSAVASFRTTKVSCTTGTGGEDAIEIVSTGGTSLRYDTTGGQFIQNWKTPTGAGSCYSATMTAADGSSITALFKIK